MWDVLLVDAFPFLIIVVLFGYAAFSRYLRYRERMALIERGIVPPESEEDEPETRGYKASAITITLIGIAVTIGLLTLGPGPWLIGGLVPTAYGCALLIRDIWAKKREEKE